LAGSKSSVSDATAAHKAVIPGNAEVKVAVVQTAYANGPSTNYTKHGFFTWKLLQLQLVSNIFIRRQNSMISGSTLREMVMAPLCLMRTFEKCRMLQCSRKVGSISHTFLTCVVVDAYQMDILQLPQIEGGMLVPEHRIDIPLEDFLAQKSMKSFPKPNSTCQLVSI